MSKVDELIGVFDRGLRAVTGVTEAKREAPAAEEGELTDAERRHAAALMRVNHVGEVCAQALYEGQALTARKPEVREALREAAAEEVDHLAWCRERIDELGGRTSVLAPFFYGASMAVGVATGALGDRLSLGFVAATEDQVTAHLDRHLEALPAADAKSRAILEAMRTDESRHGVNAQKGGGIEFPPLVRQAMTLLSRAMTETTYRV